MKIYGKVIDLKEKGIQGVSVVLTSNAGVPLGGLQTDANGAFDFGTLEVPNTARISITHVSYNGLSSPVGSLGECPLTIYLSEKSASLPDVVIVAFKNRANKRTFLYYALRVAAVVVVLVLLKKYNKL